MKTSSSDHNLIYSDQKLMDWYLKEYANRSEAKLDMGKSCIRFKKVEQIPYDLIGELVGKINPKEWINIYESNIKR